MQAARQLSQRLLESFHTRLTPDPRNQNQIETGREVVLRQSKRLPQQPFDPLSPHRSAMLAGDAQSDAGSAEVVRSGEDQQSTIAGPLLAAVDPLELHRLPQMLLGPKSIPFQERLASTSIGRVVPDDASHRQRIGRYVIPPMYSAIASCQGRIGRPMVAVSFDVSMTL